MTEPMREDQILRYLLDELPVLDVFAFREDLDSDQSLEAKLRSRGEDLRAWGEGHCVDVAPSKRVWAKISSEISATDKGRRASSFSPAIASTRLWRIAALLLLLANFGWIAHWFLSGRRIHPESPRGAIATTVGDSDAPEAPVSNPANTAGDDLAPTTSSDPASLSLSLREKDLRILELREALLASNRAFRLAQQDRDHLAVRLKTFFQPQAGRSQLTLIELRPEGADPLHIASGAHLALLDGVPTETNLSLENPDARTPGLPSVSFGAVDSFVPAEDVGAFADGVPPGLNDAREPETGPEEAGTAASPSPPQTAESASETTAALDAANSAALAIWRDDLQTGFVNLYGLPNPTEGNHYTLWTRSSEAASYMPVGVLPNPDNGVLLIDFTVEASDFHPSDILVTEESETGAATQPSKKIVLHGP